MNLRHGRLPRVVAAVALLVLMVGMSPHFGATWDERFQQKLGELTWDYFAGTLPRSSFENTHHNTDFMYGGLVDFLCVAAQKVVPLDIYVVRHMVIAVFGWFGVLAIWLLASRLFGATAGWLAALLTVVSPRYIGHSMNNPKDIPFALAMCLGLYFILTMRREYPFVDRRSGLGLAGAAALALNMRPVGMLLFFYAAMMLAFLVLTAREWSPRRLAFVAVRFVAVVTGGVLAGTAFWPWAQGQPLVRPFEAFLFASSFGWIPSAPSPWYYAPMWFAITVPPVLLLGAALSIVAFVNERQYRVPLAVLWLVFAFPIVSGMIRGAKYYDGVRHLFFVFPPLVALAAGGWYSAIHRTQGARRRFAVALLVIGVSEPIVFQLRNHPNEIVYFNALAGGPRGAFPELELDYWGNCILQSTEWSAALAREAQMPLTIWGNPPQVAEADVKRFHELWFTWRRGGGEYHLDMRLLKGPERSVVYFANRPDVLHAVRTADGTPLCVTIPGPRYWELEARLRRLKAGR